MEFGGARKRDRPALNGNGTAFKKSRQGIFFSLFPDFLNLPQLLLPCYTTNIFLAYVLLVLHHLLLYCLA